MRLATTGAVAAIAIGVVFMSAASERSRTPTAPLPSSEVSTPEPTQNAYIEPTATPEPTPEATDPVKILESVPLDAQTQSAIFELCGSDRIPSAPSWPSPGRKATSTLTPSGTTE